MTLVKNKYTQDNSSLVVDIKKIHYQNSSVAKVRYVLLNKFNGFIYEQKNARLLKSQISSWRLHSGL